WYYNLIEREQLRPETPSIERIQELQKQAMSREEALIQAFRDATQAEAKEAGARSKNVSSLEVAQSSIRKDAQVVEYFALEDRIFACVLSSGSFDVTPVTLQSTIATLITSWRKTLPKTLNDLQASRDAEAHLEKFYGELIAPIRHLLVQPHLIFIPYGLLYQLPFHAFFDDKGYLLERYTVSYAPSSGCLFIRARSSSVSFPDFFKMLSGIPIFPIS